MIYRVFGLVLAANRAIPGLPPVQETTPDVRVTFGEASPATPEPRPMGTPWYVSPYTDDVGDPLVTVWRLTDAGGLRFRFHDGTEFVVDGSGRDIQATWPAPLTFADAVSYFLGPMMGVLLRLRGALSLHASAIAIDGIVVALMGREGAGKSTTAAAFAERGCAIVSDDVLPLFEDGHTWHAQPSYPRLRLWPSSVALLADLTPTFPRLPDDWGDRRYHVDFDRHGYQFASQPLPLGAIYLLDARTADPRAPIIDPIGSSEALMTLVANTFAARILDKTMRAREFEQIARLVARVPIRRVQAHENPAAMPRLCDAILSDVDAQVTVGV
jgi:hypothetical protein